MTHTEEERKSERRHETTYGGVTAYAGHWTTDARGGQVCTVSSKGHATMDVTVAARGTIELSDDLIFGTEALVLAKVLQEAATLAQGGEVAS